MNRRQYFEHLSAVHRMRQEFEPGVISMTEIATFGAGCFWGVEAAFQRVPGMIDTAVGYSGGETPNPTYKDLCTDETGHAEGVQGTFDPAKLRYEQLLRVFCETHAPTHLNRHWPDVGT